MDIRAEMDKDAAESFLKGRKELSHIYVRVRGDLITLESFDEMENKHPHARMRRLSQQKWHLEMPSKRKWGPTFIEGTIEELMQILQEQFFWVLAPL